MVRIPAIFATLLSPPDCSTSPDSCFSCHTILQHMICSVAPKARIWNPCVRKWVRKDLHSVGTAYRFSLATYVDVVSTCGLLGILHQNSFRYRGCCCGRKVTPAFILVAIGIIRNSLNNSARKHIANANWVDSPLLTWANVGALCSTSVCMEVVGKSRYCRARKYRKGGPLYWPPLTFQVYQVESI